MRNICPETLSLSIEASIAKQKEGMRMEDLQIIELYLQRDEMAILETEKKYGSFCRKIAKNILQTDEYAEECVNDTYLQAWNAIPPQRPQKFGAWLGKVVRNIAINLWTKNHRQKRFAGIEELLNELEDCIPSSANVEREIEEQELTAILNTWLAALKQEERILFSRRYWNGETIKVLAAEHGVTPGKMAKRMYQLRQNFKSLLEKEGYIL